VVRAALGGDPDSDCGVDLEFTESQIMEDIESCVKKLTAIRAIGLQLSLDDFGTGYSSLSYLSRLPLDSLKVDGSFVRGMVNSQADTSIVSAVISLAQSMRLKVVAECVETEEQARLLQLLRCDQMQGFLISRAVPLADFEKLLRKQR
jgi:EAL domain-containing protein (putative c-di-GMP-specific phosphodiesterase class I)